MRDEAYEKRILEETSRTIRLIEKQCRMCSGVGGNGWESICTACDGEGCVETYIYESCGCAVEADECEEQECFERCAVMIDLGEQCHRQAVHTAREPFTPASFEIRCCQEHYDDFISQGYLPERKAS